MGRLVLAGKGRWWLYATFALGSLGLSYLIVKTALEKGISNLDRGVLLLIGMAALLAFCFSSGIFGRKKRTRSVGDDGEAPISLMLIFFNVAGVLGTAVSLTAPRPAVESKSGVIEEGINKLIGKAEQIDQTTQITQRDTAIIRKGLEANGLIGKAGSRIRKKIAGIWGETGCRVTYNFTLNSDSLSVRSVQSEPGMADYQGKGSVVQEENDRMITIANDTNAGTAAEFEYRTDGVSEWLVWRDRSVDVGQELVRCP